jgi:RND family efflux transporter MFP subunit
MALVTSTPSPKSGPDLSRLRIARDDGPRVTRRRGGGIAWLLLVTLLGGLGWAYATGRVVIDPVGDAGPPRVETALVTTPGGAAGAPAKEEKANGYIVARRKAALSTVLSGRLLEVNVIEGQTIPEGFVVARIQHDDYDAALLRAGKDVAVAVAHREELSRSHASSLLDLDRLKRDNAVLDDLVRQAEAEADRTKRDLERNEPLRGKVVDGATWDRMKAAADAAAATLEAARTRVRAATSAVTAWEGEISRREAGLATADAEIAKAKDAEREAAILLEKTFVRAPFAGLVIRKDAEVGEVVAATGAGGNSRGSVATIIDPLSLEVQVEPSESRLTRIKQGDRTQVILEASPTTKISGKVRQVWPTADRQKATVEIRVSLDELPPILRPDMGALVIFLGSDAPATAATPAERPLVPRKAVGSREGASVVFVLEGETVKRRTVTLGAEKGELVEVVSGLSGGERVILSPAADLADGAKVRTSK